MDESTTTDDGQGQAPEAGDSGQAPNTEPSATTPEPASEPAKTFDADYVKTLRKEAATARSRATSAEQKLAEMEDKGKTETERLADRVSASEKRAAEAESALLRYEVATARELPNDAVPLLSGTTREELEASADRLLAFATKQKSSAVPSFDGGTRTTPAAKASPEQAHNELLLRAFGKQP